MSRKQRTAGPSFLLSPVTATNAGSSLDSTTTSIGGGSVTRQKCAVAPAWLEIPIEFRKDNDLIGKKRGVYEEELGRRIVWVSPAVYSLLQTDKSLILPRLMVLKGRKVIPIMDIAE